MGQSHARGNVFSQDRDIGFAPARGGKLFTFGDQTAAEPATYTAQTSFVATTPYLIFRKAAGTCRHALRSISLSQTGTVAGGEIKIRVAMDIADRLSGSTGTLLTPQNMSREYRGTAITDLTVRVNATATAQVDASLDWLASYSAVAQVGSTITLNFADGLILDNQAGSILVYVYAATTGPTFAVSGLIVEEIQANNV